MKYDTDYYKILGIREDADKKSIKKAYKQLALKYHPDINKTKDAEQKFKKINEAYDILSDDKERIKYDEYRSKHYTTTKPVKKETSPRYKKRRKRSTTRKSNISQYINMATRLEEDYGLISGLIGLTLNNGRRSTVKRGLSSLLKSKQGHGKRRRRHRYGRQ